MNLGKRRKNHHNSYKAGIVYCDSSYEIKAALMLDADPAVTTYQSHIGFTNAVGKKRIIDFLVTYTDGTKKLIEVKPFRRLDEFAVQIEDNKVWAAQNNYSFTVWTESDLGFSSEHDATRWADHYLSTINKIDYVTARKELNAAKGKRHYNQKIATNKVEIFCEYCKEHHNPLRMTYDKNIARNKRYICEREGGHIAGSKPKPHLRKENPFEAEGKKECIKCHKILLFKGFSPTKNTCKECRANFYREKYQENK